MRYARGESHVTNLFAHDPLSPLAYLMVTFAHFVAGNLPIKTLIARQWQTHTNTHSKCTLH